jgi:predicted  nucleic acid-binding Zn-ribbon protein
MTRMNYDGQRRRELVRSSKQQRSDLLEAFRRENEVLRRRLEALKRELEALKRKLEKRERDIQAREHRVTRLMWEKKLGAYSSR